MKQFVKAVNKECACSKFIQKKFPKLSVEKVKESVFVGPQVRTLSKDPLFLATVKDLEKNAWLSVQKWYQNSWEILKLLTMKKLWKIC